MVSFIEYLFVVQDTGTSLRPGIPGLTDKAQVCAYLNVPVNVTLPPESCSVVGDAFHERMDGVGVGVALADIGLTASVITPKRATGTETSARRARRVLRFIVILPRVTGPATGIAICSREFRP
jgi:hypothetical protein